MTRPLPVLDLPAFTEVRRGPYMHTISATRWSTDGRAEVLLKYGPTLRGAIWAPLEEVTHNERPIKLITPNPRQLADDQCIAAEERHWADLRITRRQEATAHPRR